MACHNRLAWFDVTDLVHGLDTALIGLIWVRQIRHIKQATYIQTT